MTVETSPLDAVTAIVARSLRCAPGLGPDSDVFALGADSMVMMSVVAQIEERFEIEFAPEHLVKEALRTPRMIVALLRDKYDVATTPAR